MSSFTWLHITDRHAGQVDEDLSWIDVRPRFFEDLKQIRQEVGPLDLVLFTGDLSYSGTRDEFKILEQELDELQQELAALGSFPLLLAVPGNHDLQRPPAEEMARNPDGVIPEARWKSAEGWSTVENLFATYKKWWDEYHTRWWRAYREGAISDHHAGRLPGDFTVTLRKGDHKLGVMGLNSAFAQIAGGDFYGRLALGAGQAHAACDGGSLTSWLDDHDAALLLTHHPAEWLSSQSRRNFHQRIYAPGHFAVHLFGHMHEHECSFRSESGAKMRRFWQGRALFGCDYVGDSNEEKRAHGYSFGKIEMRGSTGYLYFWPRKFIENPFRFIADDALVTTTDNHTGAEEIPLRLRPIGGRDWLVPIERVHGRLKRLGLEAESAFLLPRRLELKLWSGASLDPIESWVTADDRWGGGALAAAISSVAGLQTDMRIVVLTGEPGVGKTTLLLRYMASLPADHRHTVYIECATGGQLLSDDGAHHLIGDQLKALDQERPLTLLVDGLDEAHLAKVLKENTEPGVRNDRLSNALENVWSALSMVGRPVTLVLAVRLSASTPEGILKPIETWLNNLERSQVPTVVATLQPLRLSVAEVRRFFPAPYEDADVDEYLRSREFLKLPVFLDGLRAFRGDNRHELRTQADFLVNNPRINALGRRAHAFFAWGREAKELVVLLRSRKWEECTELLRKQKSWEWTYLMKSELSASPDVLRALLELHAYLLADAKKWQVASHFALSNVISLLVYSIGQEYAANVVDHRFRLCNLRWSYLGNLDLTYFKFEGVDLRGASFSGSNVTHAEFVAADVEGATWDGAIGQETALWERTVRPKVNGA